MMMTRGKVVLAGIAIMLSVSIATACGGGNEEADGAGGAGGGIPDPDIVAALRELPVFPNADPASLDNGKYTYVPGASETGRDLWTGFYVLPGTTVEDVTSFFAKTLPQNGWQEEGPPLTKTGEKEGAVSKTVVYSFLRGGVRLQVQIPLTHKDAPEGVTNVNLILVPKETILDGSPVGTPVEFTPPPTAPQKTPDYTAPPLPSYVPTPVTPRP